MEIKGEQNMDNDFIQSSPLFDQTWNVWENVSNRWCKTNKTNEFSAGRLKSENETDRGGLYGEVGENSGSCKNVGPTSVKTENEVESVWVKPNFYDVLGANSFDKKTQSNEGDLRKTEVSNNIVTVDEFKSFPTDIKNTMFPDRKGEETAVKYNYSKLEEFIDNKNSMVSGKDGYALLDLEQQYLFNNIGDSNGDVRLDYGNSEMINLDELPEEYGYKAVGSNFAPVEGNSSASENIIRRRIQCELCSFKTARKVKLLIHITCKHIKELPYKCMVCEYKCVQRQGLLQHILTSHNEEGFFKCTLCDYKTLFKDNLTHHVLSNHSKEKPYSCEFCDYACAMKGSLLRHVFAKHSKEKPFKCQMCKYESTQKVHLLRHIRHIHSNEKPYNCELCDYRSAQKNHLLRHFRSVHSGERPFHCEFCDYKSGRKDRLKRHTMSKHTFERPFKCVYCDYSSVRKEDFLKHVDSKHINVKFVECAVCGHRCLKKQVLINHMREHKKTLKTKKVSKPLSR